MKKYLVLVVALSMLLVLTGCKEQNLQDAAEVGDIVPDFTDDQGPKVDEEGNLVEEEMVEGEEMEEATEEVVEEEVVVEEVIEEVVVEEVVEEVIEEPVVEEAAEEVVEETTEEPTEEVVQ